MCSPFHSCQIFASLHIEGASNLDAFVSGLDICLASCSMMSDSFSDVFACSFFIKLSGTSLKMKLVFWSKCVTRISLTWREGGLQPP